MSTHPYRSSAGRERRSGESGDGETTHGLRLAMAIAESALFLLCLARLWLAVRKAAFGFEAALSLLIGVLLAARLGRWLRRSRGGGPFV
jgi:hypothetical protein